MLPVYTRYLSAADYGLLQLLDMTTEVAAILLTAGVTSGMQRFYFKATDDRQRGSVVFSTFIMQLVLSVAGAALLALCAPLVWQHGLRGAGSVDFVRLAAVNFVLNSMVAIPLLFLQTQQRPVAYVGASTGRLALQLTLNITFIVGLELGVAGILWSTFVANLLVAVALNAWMLKQTGMHADRGTMKDLQRFGTPYKFSVAGNFVLTFGDRFFLQATRTVAEVGVYGLAYQFGFLLNQLSATPFLSAWDPHRYQLIHEPRATRDVKYAVGFFYFNIVMISIAVGIAVFIRPVLSIITTSGFHEAALPVPVILLAYVTAAWTAATKFGIDVSEQTRFYSYATGISVVVTLAAYATLIPPYGSMGAAWATLIGFAARFAATMFWAQRLYPISYGWARPLMVTAIGIAVVVAGRAVTPATVLRQLEWAALLWLVFASLVALLVLKRSERQFLVVALRSPRQAMGLLAHADEASPSARANEGSSALADAMA